MKRSFIYLSLLLSFNFMFTLSTVKADTNPAENGIIKGKIESKSDKKPVEYASIMVYSLPDSALITGTISLSDGGFKIEHLSKGNYYLVVYFMGFHKKFITKLNIDAKNQVVDCGKIILEENNTTLSGVEIMEQ